MPIWNHLARCHECGKQWIVGDCIPSTCPECECKKRGHLWVGSVCGRCGKTKEWQSENERTVKWDKEQTEYLRKKLPAKE